MSLQLKEWLERDCDGNEDECTFKADAEAFRKLKEQTTKIKLKGNKVDLVRVLVALNDCRMFETEDGLAPNQESLMQEFGKFLNIDLSNHNTILSNSLDQKLETNLKIFEDMKKKLQNRHSKKENP